jgi:K+-transporting ATPase c subunit
LTASGSGLDPHISVANAEAQSARVAQARHLDKPLVDKLIVSAIEPRSFGLFGEPRVNVLRLNLALDAL